MQYSEPFTKLNNRILLHNGVTVVPPSRISGGLLKQLSSKYIRATKLTPELVEFNSFAEHPIKPFDVDSDLKFNINTDLILPIEYIALDVVALVTQLHGDYITTKENYQRYHSTFKQELSWFQTHDKLSILKTVKFIVDRLKQHNIPWGLGRGSSVYSYILFLLELHSIDPIEHDLDYKEFLRDNI